MINDELSEIAGSLNDRREPYALITVVRAVAPTSAYLGAQAIVRADGTLHGWIGGGCAQGVVIDAARDAIGTGEPRLVRISNDRIVGDDDVEQHAMACASNGTIELFIQPYGARSALCILGDTPAADEARFQAGRLGIRVAGVPDEARIVLVATQGLGDEDALEAALKSPASDVLMIASRRKAQRLRDVMRMRGVDETQLARLCAPAGPDVGAKTPAEIALAAIVGVLSLLRGRGRAFATDRVRPSGADSSDATPGRAPAESAASDAARSGKFVNPVCGMAVDMAAPKHVETYEDVAYYFCCDGCLSTFRQDPAKYAQIHRTRTEHASS